MVERLALVLGFVLLAGASIAQVGVPADLAPVPAPVPAPVSAPEPPSQPAAPLADRGRDLALQRLTLPSDGAEARPGPDAAERGAVGLKGAGLAPAKKADTVFPAKTDFLSLAVAAHPVVQSVMAGLVAAQFVALTVLVYKMAEYVLAGRRLARTARLIATAEALPAAVAALTGQRGPGADMVRAAAAELSMAEADHALLPGTRDRTRAVLSRIEAGAALMLRGGTGVLASIGSLAPFVGLFGTVFGIMNSFLAIADTRTTSLAVVAPGIAEALLATAIGLAAAIPAVLIYNVLTRLLAVHRHRMADLVAAIETLQSRALDQVAARHAPSVLPFPLPRTKAGG